MIPSNTNNLLIDTTKLKASRTRWVEADLESLQELISKGVSLELIAIKLGRSDYSISAKGYEFGYKHKKNPNGLTYFTKKINLKYKRIKDEIMKESKPIPISQEEAERLDIEVASNNITNVGEILMKAGQLLKSHMRTKPDNDGGVS